MERRVRNIEKVDRDKWDWTIEEKFNKEIKLDREKVKRWCHKDFISS